MRDITILRELLETPTYSGQEARMINYLVNYCTGCGYDSQVDSAGNVLIIKGKPPVDGFYPLVCAHTDTVHPPGPPVTVMERRGNLLGYADDLGGVRAGMGGDDKAGIFVCLELLRTQPCLKVALFTSEEIGCLGSKSAEDFFFQDVGYAIEFDSPHNDIVSFSCDGQELFDDKGQFIRRAELLLETHGTTKWQRHPYTDVAVLRRRFGFECLNLPCGYFAMHSEHDFVNLAGVENAIELGTKLLTVLGCQRYTLKPGFKNECVGRYVTGFML